MSKLDVVVIGAGLSGLSAAIHLQNEGLNIKVFEASDGVGGRARTDHYEGFLLDRGFQVLLTAYPETRKMLNYEALDLKHFYPGALIQFKEKIYQFSDPFRKPLDTFKSLFNPIANWGDKLKILALRNRLRRFEPEDIFKEKEMSTYEYLKEWNFSDKIIDRFFRPFLGGIFLNNDLTTSSRMFEFVFKMFGEGYAALPAEGMGAIAIQLAEKLNENTIEFNNAVKKVNKGELILANGEKVACRNILVATDSMTANRLIGTQLPTAYNSVKCLYFSSDMPPYKQAILMLNANEGGLVNNVCVPSVINSNYAPEGKALISVSITQKTELEGDELIIAVKKELRKWFKKELRYWEHLRTYDIPLSLPHSANIEIPSKKDIKAIKKGIYLCGDHLLYGSINAALLSGRQTADKISWDLATNAQ